MRLSTRQLLSLLFFTYFSALFSVGQSAALETTITYQGELSQAGTAPSGAFDMEFRLFDVADGSLEIVPVVSLDDVQVVGGVFTVELDFGFSPYAGDQLWLQISIRDGDSSGGYTQLLPRQKVTATPYALHAEMVAVDAIAGSEIADGSVGAADINISQVQQRVSAACPAGSSVRQIEANGTVICENDDDTVFTVGPGLSLDRTIINVEFAGDGDAETVARSDHLHEDRYGFGDLIVPVLANGTPTENGAALIAAVAQISDASASRPYTVLLSGGLFQLPAEGVALQPFVSLRGRSRASTVLSAPGDGVNFNPTLATVILNEAVSVEDLTIINTGGDSTNAIAILGLGEGFNVRDVAVRVSSNGASLATGFVSANITGDISGRLSRVEIEVDTGNGIGGISSSGDLTNLIIDNSHIRVAGAGIGVSDPGLDSGGTLTIKDSVIEVLGGGTGYSVSGSNGSDDLVLDGVEIWVSGGETANRGMSRSGSGFRVLVRSSRIQVSGAASTSAISFSNGRITLQNSQIEAPIGLLASSFGSFAGRFFADNSVLDVSTAIQIEGTSTGTHQVRIGASKVDANTNINVVSGLVNAVCVNVHNEDYQALGSDCL